MTPFSLILLVYTITITGATLFNSAQFTTTNSGTKNGATLTIENPNDVNVNTNYWDVIITNQQGWQFRLDLDTTWGFHPLKLSTIIFTMHGIIPVSVTDQDWLITFSVKSTEYFSTFIPVEPRAQNYIVPNCSDTQIETNSLLSGDVYTTVNNINSTDWNERVLGVGFPTRNVAGWNMKPNNWVANKSIEYPIIYQLQNDPINNVLKITFTTPTWESQNFRQICYYNSFTANEGLNIFIAGDDPGETYAVSMFDIKYYYDSDNPTVTPTRFPSKYPTVAPSVYPTDSPTRFPSVYPTELPSFQPSKNPSFIPTINPSHMTNEPSNTPTKNPTNAPTAPEGKIPIDLSTTSVFGKADNDDSEQQTSASGLPRDMLYIIGAAVILLLCIVILCIMVKILRNNRDEKLSTEDTVTVKINNTGENINEMARITSISSLNDIEHALNTDIDINVNKQDQLSEWLSNIKLIHLYDLFAKEKFDINFEIIHQLRDSDLKEMGVNTMSERKIILNQIAKDQIAMTAGAVSPQSHSTTNELTSEFMTGVGPKRGSESDHDGSDSLLFNEEQVNITPVIKVTPNVDNVDKEKLLLDNMQKEIQEAIYETAM
eukprot:397121_1